MSDEVVELLRSEERRKGRDAGFEYGLHRGYCRDFIPKVNTTKKTIYLAYFVFILTKKLSHRVLGERVFL